MGTEPLNDSPKRCVYCGAPATHFRPPADDGWTLPLCDDDDFPRYRRGRTVTARVVSRRRLDPPKVDDDA